jgi:1-acyl-sn-glycerol-3-phosphate acyltransferase
VKLLRATWRALRATGVAFAGWWIIVVLFPRWTQERRNARVQQWAREMLVALGITLKIEGAPPAQGPMLLVANHMSWLDILVMHAARHCRFVAKSEVRHWPLVGTLATGGGTLYIERANRRDAMRVVHHMADSLRAGEIVAVFPEGTTGDGSGILPFHANLIQAAVSAHAPVQPIALRFVEPTTGRDSTGPLYLDDETLVGSMWRALTAPPFEARVKFGEPQSAEGRDRRGWAAGLQVEVDRLWRAIGGTKA